LQHVSSETVLEQIAELLKNENRYIANQAYNYLSGLDLPSKSMAKKIEKYKRKSF